MKIAVGIGNPGRRYDRTRHNVGYRVIEKLARYHGAAAPKEQFDSLLQDVLVDGEKLVLLRPLTYVNLSGSAVRRTADWYRCPIDDLIVICDDMNLPLGRLRVRRAGSSGGHNGLESLIQHLGTTAFARVRVGIGSPPPPMAGVDYVLGRFTEEEEPVIEAACNNAASAVITWVRRGIDECMSRHNSPKVASGGEKSKTTLNEE